LAVKFCVKVESQAPHIFHFVFDAALARCGRKLGDRIQHRLIAIRDPKINGFDATRLIIEQLFPGVLVLVITDTERQNFALTIEAHANHG